MLSSGGPADPVCSNLVDESGTEPLGFVVALLPFWYCANRTEALLANGRWNGPPAVFRFCIGGNLYDRYSLLSQPIPGVFLLS